MSTAVLSRTQLGQGETISSTPAYWELSDSSSALSSALSSPVLQAFDPFQTENEDNEIEDVSSTSFELVDTAASAADNLHNAVTETTNTRAWSAVSLRAKKVDAEEGQSKPASSNKECSDTSKKLVVKRKCVAISPPGSPIPTKPSKDAKEKGPPVKKPRKRVRVSKTDIKSHVLALHKAWQATTSTTTASRATRPKRVDKRARWAKAAQTTVRKRYLVAEAAGSDISEDAREARAGGWLYGKAILYVSNDELENHDDTDVAQSAPTMVTNDPVDNLHEITESLKNAIEVNKVSHCAQDIDVEEQCGLEVSSDCDADDEESSTEENDEDHKLWPEALYAQTSEDEDFDDEKL